MRNSLQDQLLKSGLVTEEQLEGARAPGRKRRPRARKRKNKAPSEPAPPSIEKREAPRPIAKLRSDQQRSAHILRDSKLGGQSPEQRAKKQRQREALRLAEQNKLNAGDAEIAHHFVRGRRVKRIYLTPEQRGLLLRGELAIVGIEGNHYLVPNAVVDQILALLPETFVLRGGEDDGGDETREEGDEYADYPIPDDLHW